MKRETLIRPRHLERLALVYVRQSTPGQVLENRESTRLQYELRERAEQLGWPRERIETIDEDLGCSGSGEVRRAGFARLLRSVARGRVGAVFGLDAVICHIIWHENGLFLSNWMIPDKGTFSFNVTNPSAWVSRPVGFRTCVGGAARQSCLQLRARRAGSRARTPTLLLTPSFSFLQ